MCRAPAGGIILASLAFLVVTSSSAALAAPLPGIRVLGLLLKLPLLRSTASSQRVFLRRSVALGDVGSLFFTFRGERGVVA